MPTRGESIPNEGIGQEYFDHDDHSEFMHSHLTSETNMFRDNPASLMHRALE